MRATGVPPKRIQTEIHEMPDTRDAIRRIEALARGLNDSALGVVAAELRRLCVVAPGEPAPADD